MEELIQSSTIHGVGHIYSASTKLSKFLWSILFFLGVVGITVNIVFVTMKFLSNPVLISYTFEHEPFIWPDITFCNPTDPYYLKENSKYLDHWNEIANQTKNLASILAGSTDLAQLIHRQEATDAEIEERALAMSSADPIKLGANKYENHVTYVGYIKSQNGLYFVKEFERNPKKFTENLEPLFTAQIIQLRNNIPCHTFHIDKSKDKSLDLIRSLVFRFKFNEDSYKIFNSSYTFQSVFLYINNKDEMPQENEIIMTPGYNNIVSLSQSRYQHNGIRRKCRNTLFEVDLYDSLLSTTNKFHGNYEDCKKITSQKYYVEKCKCYSPFLPIYKNITGFPRLCLNATIYSKSEIIKNTNCLTNSFKKTQSSPSVKRKLLYTCKQYARIPCDKMSYKIDHRKEMLVDLWSKATNDRRLNIMKQISFSIFGSNVTSDDFTDKLKDNIMQLFITRDSKFGDLYKEERAYPFAELLSDIGGLMGLWLGLSVVGLFEIVEFLYLMLIGILTVGINKKESLDKINQNEQECTIIT